MTTSAVLAEPTSQTGQKTDPQSGLISEDALRTLALSAQPFSNEVADGDWFTDNTTREQLVDIKEALINGEDLLLITGELGSGKSVLLKQLSGSGGSRIQCFSVRGSQRFSTTNLFTGLLEAFKLKPPVDLEDTLKDVIPCLQALAERNMLGVIVLDDADLVSDQELSLLLGSLQYLNGGEDSLLRVLLAAKPEFESRIPGLLASTSELPYATLAIEPFDIGRSAAYLEHRLNKVGTFNESPFTEQQLLSICQSANGLPSGLNTVAAAEINAFQLALSSGNEGAMAGNAAEGAANQSQREQTNSDAPASGSILQSQPLRMVLGLSAVAMLATAAWLFVNPDSSTGKDNGFAIVSKSPVTPIAVEATSPELITLVEEPAASTDTGLANNAITENALTTPAESEREATEQQAALAQTQLDTAPDIAETDAEPPAIAAAAPDNTTSVSLSVATNAAALTSGDQPSNTETSATAPAVSTEVAAPVAEVSEPAVPEPASAAPTTPEPAAQTPATPEPASQQAAAPSALPLESANWVLVQNRELYTVQMSASDDRQDVEDFLKRSKLDAPNSIFSFKRGDNTWFALVHGLYPTITDARNAIESMPNSAKANQPWIRAISQIQDSVKSN